jgi:antitoxin YefM
MTAVSFDTAKNSLADLMDQVATKHEPVLIEAANGKPVVLVSLEDFESWDTTTYLLSDPRNRERLLRGAADMDAGKGVIRELTSDP